MKVTYFIYTVKAGKRVLYSRDNCTEWKSLELVKKYMKELYISGSNEITIEKCIRSVVDFHTIPNFFNKMSTKNIFEKKWFGSYRPLDDLTKKIKKCKTTWWIKDTLKMDGTDSTADLIDAAKTARMVPVKDVLVWNKMVKKIDFELDLWPVYTVPPRQAQKINFVIKKIKKSIADNKPVIPACGVVSKTV